MIATQDHKPMYDRRESKFAGRTFAGLEYDSELSGPDGAHFFLFAPPETSRDQIRKAKDECRNNHDATGFTVLQIPAEWVEPEHKPKPKAEWDGVWLESLRFILKNGCRRMDENGGIVPEGKRGGTLVDHFSASAAVGLYDALNKKNQVKLLKLGPCAAISLGFECMSKPGKGGAV